MKQASKMMLLFFIIIFSSGHYFPKQKESKGEELAYHLNSLDDIVLTKASEACSLSQLFNQDHTFDKIFAEFIVDSQVLTIANAKALFLNDYTRNVFYTCISINAP